MAYCSTYEALALAWLYDESSASPADRVLRRQRVYTSFAEALQGRWLYGGFSFHDFALEELSGLASARADIEAFVQRRTRQHAGRLPKVVVDPLRPWRAAADLWLTEWLFAEIREGHTNDWWVRVDPFEVISAEYVPVLRDVWLRTIEELDGVTPETTATIVRADRALEGWGEGWCDCGLSLVLDTAPHPRVVRLRAALGGSAATKLVRFRRTARPAQARGRDINRQVRT